MPAFGVVFIGPCGDSKVKATIRENVPGGCKDTIELDYSCEHLAVYDAGGSLIDPDTPVTDGETVYISGTSASEDVDDSDVTFWDVKADGTSTSLDQADFTVVSVSLQSITFTSNFRSLFMDPAGHAYEGNAVYQATTLGSEGQPVGGTDWSSQNPDVSHAIAQKMGTTLSATIVLNVQPAGFQYTISSTSWSLDDTADSYMNFTSQPGASLGGSDSITVNSDVPLPNMIADINQGVLWTVNDASERFAQSIGRTTHEIFVTYDSPKSDCSLGANSVNYITDVRLRKAVQICNGATNQDDAALASQQWVATNLTFDSDNEKTNYPAAVDDFWKFIGGLAGDNGQSFQGQCAQFGVAQELILRTLGIDAIREHLYATLESTWSTGNANTTGMVVQQNKNNSAQMMDLVMNFPNTGLNQGEDTVRVGDQVYTEGTPRDLFVGEDNTTFLSYDNNLVYCTAELEALVELAESKGNLATFQVWADSSTRKMLNPPVYAPLPPIMPIS